MKTYDNSRWASSSYLLDYAAEAIHQDLDTLEHWATKAARLVFVGGLDFYEAWDALWLAAVAAGLPHLVAQQRIGEAFAQARTGSSMTAQHDDAEAAQ